MKKIYQAILPSGEVVTRTTERTYTHVIICRQAGKPEASLFALTWAGSPALAEKAARATISRRMETSIGTGKFRVLSDGYKYEVMRTVKTTSPVWADVQIIPCQVKGV